LPKRKEERKTILHPKKPALTSLPPPEAIEGLVMTTYMCCHPRHLPPTSEERGKWISLDAL